MNRSFLSPFRVVICFVTLAVLALSVVPRLSVSLQPLQDSPNLYISFGLPQSSPEMVEQLVTAPLENMLSSISEVERISSVSNYHSGSITLYFDKNVNMDFKKFEVSSLIRQLYPKLPPNASYPLVVQGAAGSQRGQAPVLVYSINAAFTASEIKKVVENTMRAPLSLYQEVEQVRVTGAMPTQLVLEYDEQKMLYYGIGKEDFVELLQRQSRIQYLGAYFNEAGQRLFITTEQAPGTLSFLEELYLRPNVQVKQVARVYSEEEESQSYFRINGLNSVRLAIYAKRGINAIELAKQLKAAAKQLQSNLPKGYEVILESDSTEHLSKELDKIYKRTFLSVAILLVLILLAHRNFRYLLALLSGVAINLALSLACIYLLGIQVHIYSLAGMTISFGMILDNAIVMLDHLRKKGNLQVFLALLGATLTSIAALLLVWLLPEEDQYNLSDFAYIIIVNLAVSLLVAWLFTPAMYKLLLARQVARQKPASWRSKRRGLRFLGYYGALIAFFARYRKSFMLFWILLFGTPVFMLPTKIEGWEWYNKSYGNEYYQEHIRPYVDKILGGSLRLFVNEVFENSGYRSMEQTTLYVNAEMPFGTTSEQMNKVMLEVEDYLKGVSGLDKFITNVYSGQEANIRITFQPRYERGALPYMLRSRLIAQSINWGGVGWDIYGVGEGFSNRSGENIASFRVEMRGYNYLELERQAEALAKKLLRHKRIQEVKTNERLSYQEKSTSQYVLALRYPELRLRGMSAYDLGRYLELRAKPSSPNLYGFYQQEWTPIVLRSQSAEAFSAFQLSGESLPFGSGKALKMNQVSDLRFERTNNALHKENRQYIRMVAFEYYGGHKFGYEYLQECLKALQAEMPIGYSTKVLEYRFDFGKTKRRYGILAYMLLGIFCICSILFESFRQPLIIIFTVPLSFIGLFLTFAWGNFYFDQGGYAAFVLLGGLVVNAAIFIINDFNNSPGRNAQRRVLKAIWYKAAPILMTVCSTVLGLLPFLTEGDREIFWFSFAIGAIGGLLFSLLGVFLVVPVWLYGAAKKSA
jgi:multidrug efflux pump subunit AcrB